MEADSSEAGNSDASKLSGMDSTCCVVELKYRARLGRRNVGGSADDGIRVSNMGLLIILLSIVKADILFPVTNCWRADVEMFYH